jgi:regulator of extracellular matrix RemA (YlzA/DUF370 family)
MQLLNIGFGNLINAKRIIAIVGCESAPIKRIVSEAREKGMLIDASFGRKSRTVIVCDSEHVVLSALQADIISARLNSAQDEQDELKQGVAKSE